MASISSTGVGSGLDVNTIVTQLMSVEQRPLTLLQTTASGIQTKLSAFGTLQGQIASLGDVVTRIADPSAWNPMRVDLGDSSVATATATTAASAGAHSLEVEQLAKSQVLASGPFLPATKPVGTGKLTIELGTTTNGVFAPRDGSSPVPITIDSSNQTLAGIRDAINASKAGVTASIVTGSGGAQLVLRGGDGAAGSMRILVADDDNDDTNAAGLSQLAYDPAAGAAAGRNLTQTQQAQDAKFSIDGVALTSATNTPSDALQGVTITLKGETGGPVALNVAVETTAVRKNINDFVNAYNALNTLVRNQTQADPTGKANGALQADSTAVSLLNQMRALLQGQVIGAASTSSSLSVAGIAIQRDGSLQVTDAKLTPLLSDPAQLAKLFAQPQAGTDAGSRGFAVRFKAWAKALTGDAGALQSRLDGLKRSQSDNQKRQDAENDRLARKEAALRAQYQALDTQMTTLNQRMAQMKSALGLS
ncbi:flagellar filament capping protein FliD [Ramlibacter humi]|uniref:Flagellar hook-associated protein 2 n=1 Tax=Ramlibacter humi TaxID=2530451 RepID=A0A4Z0CBT1_9BURK|nr:flagellar filament capping protein FliD [Ramlibacter humi]TFZ08352.1 flagellar hook protein [Ramlibacter humi]